MSSSEFRLDNVKGTADKDMNVGEGTDGRSTGRANSRSKSSGEHDRVCVASVELAEHVDEMDIEHDLSYGEGVDVLETMPVPRNAPLGVNGPSLAPTPAFPVEACCSGFNELPEVAQNSTEAFAMMSAPHEARQIHPSSRPCRAMRTVMLMTEEAVMRSVA